MQLTRYTEYSLRVLMYLAIHPERLATITEISGAYNISRNHLVKVVHELGTLGFIKTQRGKQGGIRLARTADELTVGEVVRQVEKNLEIVDCTDPACPILPVCDLRDALYQARGAFFEVLDGYTLADLTKPHRVQLEALLSQSTT
jgi:Rrf2 family nitric oxide-sensitive transcriptional repressor